MQQLPELHTWHLCRQFDIEDDELAHCWESQDWIPQGKAAVRCECKALPDGVRIDMSTFKRGKSGAKRKRGGRSPKGLGAKSRSDDESSEDEEDDEDDEDDTGESSESGSSISSSDEVDLDSEEESCSSQRSARWGCF